METVGDKYMAVSGLPDPCSDHARCIARLALDFMDMDKSIRDPEGNGIKIHTHTHTHTHKRTYFVIQNINKTFDFLIKLHYNR